MSPMWILKYSFLLLFVKVSVYANTNAFTSPSCFSMGGAGSLSLSVNTPIKNPAVFNHSRSLTTSIVKYPALINSQSVNINLPMGNMAFSSSLKYLSYGIFNGYNEEGEDNGTYRSYETWIDGYMSKKIEFRPIFIGSRISLKSSNFYTHNIKALSGSFGLIRYFKDENSAIGLSINQIEFKFSNHKFSKSAPSFTLSGSKKLKYLPAIGYVDFLYEKNRAEVFMGICFIYWENIKVQAGSSTRKFSQNTSQSLSRTILGASGFGFSYNKNQILVQYGFYYYGVGIRVDGLNIGIKF